MTQIRTAMGFDVLLAALGGEEFVCAWLVVEAFRRLHG